MIGTCAEIIFEQRGNVIINYKQMGSGRASKDTSRTSACPSDQSAEEGKLDETWKKRTKTFSHSRFILLHTKSISQFHERMNRNFKFHSDTFLKTEMKHFRSTV